MKIQRCSCLVITGGEVVRSAMCPIHPPVLLPVSEAPQDALVKLINDKITKHRAWRDNWHEHERFRAAAGIAVRDFEEILIAAALALPRTPERPRGENT